MRTLRPSLLPKLAACAQYQPQKNAGATAARGTLMDRVFRDLIQDLPVPADTLDEEAWAAVSWAVDTARILAGTHPLTAAEKDLRVEACGLLGTADLLCSGALWSADLKSGQPRNYREQQAAYALGFMDTHGVDDWTVYLLFCDLREVTTLRFTREEAETMVRSVMAAALDDHPAATPCDYCDWCALKWKCPARLESVAWFLGLDPATVDLEEGAATVDPARLAQALDLTHLITREDGVHDHLKSAARQHLGAQRQVPGWKLQNGRETRTVPALALLLREEPEQGGKTLLELAGPQACMEAIGNLSAGKFQTLWAAAHGQNPIPPGLIRTHHGTPILAKARTKKPA